MTGALVAAATNAAMQTSVYQAIILRQTEVSYYVGQRHGRPTLYSSVCRWMTAQQADVRRGQLILATHVRPVRLQQQYIETMGISILQPIQTMLAPTGLCDKACVRKHVGI